MREFKLDDVVLCKEKLGVIIPTSPSCPSCVKGMIPIKISEARGGKPDYTHVHKKDLIFIGKL